MDNFDLAKQTEQKRLLALWESAIETARAANERAVRTSLDISREKTQYFEKIALGCAGTIALMVSFIGSHSSRLQPPWLLRSALILLVFAMIVAMYRNWKYPFYLLAHHAARDFEAKLVRQRCKRDYVVAVPSVALEDGQLINIEEYLRNFAEEETSLKKNLTKCRRIEDSSFNIVKNVEVIAL